MHRAAVASLLYVFLFCFVSNSVKADDWPMWRSDANRSAATQNALPSEFKPQWTRHFPARSQAWDDPLNLDLMTYDRVFEPIVYKGLLCFGFNDQDKLLALDATTGEPRWTFYTEGPVRLPPVGHAGNIYFCSDDGYLYCINATDGKLKWKFRGAPNSQHALGNKRLISAWPARGGPVVYDGDIYFAASIWPFMGTFIYSLDSESGEVNWVNDSSGSQYIKQPHSAPSFAGVAPQGAMVATEKYLIVPGGRSVPAVFDRATGKLKYFEINAGGKGTGGSFVTADDLHFYVHTREKGTRAFNLESGMKTAFVPNEPVISNGVLYSAESADDKQVVRAYDATTAENEKREPIWEIVAAGRDELVLANGTLVAASGKTLTLIDVSSPEPQIVQSTIVDSLGESEAIARLLIAENRIFVVGDAGTLTSIGAADQIVSMPAKPQVQAETPPAMNPATERLLNAGQREGYALWFGPADAPELQHIVTSSPFVQLAVIDHDPDRVDALRVSLDERGVLGKVTGHVSDPQSFKAPNYIAHRVFTTAEIATDSEAVEAMWQSVRPYGGTLTIVGADKTTHPPLAENLIALGLEQAKVDILPGVGIVLTREGALPGSADWTHQYGNVANTVKSDDERVKLPLGILWFGGSSNMDVLPRHGHGPPEQVVGGRLIIQGMNSLSARDVYTGRILWKREFEDLGTYDVYYDATYENTPLNPQYNQVHIPGANGRGTNYIVTEDRVYLLIGAKCLILDPATGDDIAEIVMPKNEDGSLPEWGYIGVYGDLLLGGIGFANYRDKHDLEFESDASLRRNRAGFGSKSFDRAASRGLIAFDRYSGKQRWRADAKHSFWHNGIVAGGGRVYCLDKNPAQIEEAMRRRGLSLPDSYRIACFNAENGSTEWEVRENIYGTWLGYSKEHDLLLQAGAQASDRLYAETGQGMRVYKAASGEVHWNKDDLKYSGPCILHNDLIITNANSYSESAGAFYLTTGEQRMVEHPITGESTPWKMTRAYGCNNIIASENLLTFRSGAAGYYDLTCDSGTGNLGGFKSGCTSNLVIANGVLNAPDYTRTCSCSYQNQTSLALVHMPEVEVWSVNSLASAESPESAGGSQDALQVQSVGINLGAAGDRHDPNGTLWLEYPAVAGDSPPFQVQYNEDARVFSQHSSTRNDDPLGWISASGISNLRELSIDLRLSEPIDLAKGLPVTHPDDDAEESSDGSVSLGSSDLELTVDESTQTVGLRFAEVPFPVGESDKIQEAYLQFIVDETSDEPASLWISGELAANAERFQAASHDISSRDRTQQKIAWNPKPWSRVGNAGEAQRTPDISPILKEIMSQPDWESGNAISFLIEGEGRRTAVASRGSGKDATKLVIHADVPQSGAKADGPTQLYDLELIFAAPRDAKTDLVFNVLVGESQVRRIVLNRDSSKAKVVTIPSVPVAEQLRLQFVPEKGSPVLSGIKLDRS